MARRRHERSLEDQPGRLLIQSGKLAWNPVEIFVSIADTGLESIHKHTVRLFAPFFTTKPEGIRNGLSRISRSIIEAHGGRLFGQKPNLAACARAVSHRSSRRE